MKTNLLAIVAIVFAVSGLASADQLLLQLNYRVKANRDYQTNFKTIATFPIFVNTIRLATRGTYCNLTINKVEYLTQNHTVAQRAYHSGYGAEYVIPAGRASSVNIHFRQTGYRRADCELLVYGVN